MIFTIYKRGDLREDGKIFVERVKGYEYWVTPNRFELIKEKDKIKARRRRILKREEINKRRRESYRLNPEAYLKRNREYANRTSRHLNSSYREYQKKYARDRRARDPEYRLRHVLRQAVYRVFKLRGKCKSERSEILLGCSFEFAMTYLESKFLPGMTWGNFGKGSGKWNIDHIIPVSKGGSHRFDNLQPLWSEDNRRKSNKLPFELST